MRKNCTFRIWWNPLTAIFCLFRSLYLGVTQYHRRVSEAQAWLSSKNDVKLETTHKKTTPTGERCNFLRTVSTRGLRCQWTEHWVRCIAIDVLSSYGFFFSTNPLNLISTVALTACPKQWPNIEWVLAIVRQSPTHHSLIRYNGTALLPTARRALVEWNVINGLGQRDSASVHPYRRIMLILSCEVLHYFFGIVSVAILLDYVTHCLRDEHFSPSFVLSWN